MADVTQIARPYARAVFGLAQEAGDLAGWSRRLAALATLVSDARLRPLLAHPRLARADLADVLVQALGAASDASFAGFLRLLVANGRLMVAPAIAAQYEALRAEAEQVLGVAITTATEVPPAQRQVLVSALARRLDRKLAVEWSVDPALIGGALIRAGDTVIDGSLRSQLKRLESVLAQ